VSLRASKTAIATAGKQADVELAKLAAEVERVSREFSEPERSNRQGTYHQLLAVLMRMRMFAGGYVSEDQSVYGTTIEQFNVLVAGVHLFGRRGVRDGLGPLAAEIEQLGRRLMELTTADPAEPYPRAFAQAYAERVEQIDDATYTLIEAMRADITRDILDE